MCIRDRLHSVLFDAGGTARGIHPDANIMDSIGKTGTTNDNKDVWFVGLTPKYVMATWYGCLLYTSPPPRSRSCKPSR